jgi:dTDP-glucose 4,6-dehydratase
VFGSLEKDSDKFTETTPYDPRSPYSASKASSDHLVRAYFHTYNLPITISNCSNNYGLRQYPEKLIPLFVAKLSLGEKVPVYGEGKNIRDWIHVDDHIRGVEMIIEKGKIGETYCLGGNNEVSNIDLTKKILDIMNLSSDMIEYVPDRLGHDFRYAIDGTKAERELGFVPQVDFSEGLKETVEWYLKKRM